MSDLGARALILSVIWSSVGLALAFGLMAQHNREEVLILSAFFLTAGATTVSLVVWLTKWPKPYTGRGFEVTQAEAVTPVVAAD